MIPDHRLSAPTARPHRSLVCCTTATFASQEWRWSRVGLPISASASWSAGSPLPLSQAGQSPAYGRFSLPSELSASLRQRMLRLELTPDVARHTAKAVEDYPHSKTLTRLPSPSRCFALCHHLAIRTGHCYSLLVCCNTATFALQEWRWSRVGLPISASASWSAGSPLPLSQAGQSPAYGRFSLPSELSASLRPRILRLELTPDVARRTAKAVEDYPHSKTLTRLPSPSRFFALWRHASFRMTNNEGAR